MKPFEGMIVGFGVGLITAALGATKDSPHEGFSMKTFWRSPIVASICGLLVAVKTPKNKSIILQAGAASTLERITTEAWKATTGATPGKFEWGENRDRGWLLPEKETRYETLN